MNQEAIARSIVDRLISSGFETYLAGGCVRDRLRGVEPKDFDIATSAHPEQVQKIFSKTVPVGVQFGVILVVENDIPFEVATFRTDGSYRDGRHPEGVTFATLEDDARRRDFTVNGMYYDTRLEKVVDLVGGAADLKAGRIRTIGQAEKRFEEDHLRLLRAVRFAIQLGFEIDLGCLVVIQGRAKDIQSVSQERVRDELGKILTGPKPGEGIRLLDRTGLLAEILPEVITLKGVEQPMEYHPEGDVYIHTLMLLDQLSNPCLELALGALFHDIAKPATFERAVDRIRFHGHDRIGAEMSRVILKRLAFSNEVTDLVCELVAEHLRFKDAFQMRVSTLKRFLGIRRFDLHLELHRIDCLSSHGKLDAYHFCQQKLGEFRKLPPPPLRLVTGDDLIALGYTPGREFSKIIRAVEDSILEGELGDKTAALAWVREKFPLKDK
ncbi:MAG: CCA tRNA nucleotidyltransferase [Deltaproteobacteria bacterium]|nr:CCA tRNA nucleotidyltransferase [Deltaproteobacteria bacterium]MBI3295223.1 CCA tRNA nucleotidyltransferase [Deltaproteobacteria bacterium]